VAIHSRDPQLIPVDFIAADAPLNSLTAQALAGRPEINDLYYRSEAARQKVLAEEWRPWIPNLHAGVSSGGFGGGVGSQLNALDGRADFDLLAVWQVRNLGFGTRAARNEASSLQRQTHLEYHRVRDSIIAQVSKAHAEVNANKRRITLARQRVERALDAHKRSLARIRGFVGLPLEALQDVQAVIEARQELVNATVDYNRAQLKLLRAIGRTASQS
jgi:outer membrane protein TolC